MRTFGTTGPFKCLKIRADEVRVYCVELWSTVVYHIFKPLQCLCFLRYLLRSFNRFIFLLTWSLCARVFPAPGSIVSKVNRLFWLISVPFTAAGVIQSPLPAWKISQGQNSRCIKWPRTAGLLQSTFLCTVLTSRLFYLLHITPVSWSSKEEPKRRPSFLLVPMCRL